MAAMYASVNLYGTPDEIEAQIRATKQTLGVDHDMLVMPKYGSMSQREAERSMALFARDVIPRFK
jgi:alkanesulfonate monooxygenase SsuD/methylene tetrahydromethanopterin reductase-like flavin-dependent oxidoreductase (luciferase family)